MFALYIILIDRLNKIWKGMSQSILFENINYINYIHGFLQIILHMLELIVSNYSSSFDWWESMFFVEKTF
jgi:hypothetical protein